MLGDPERAYAAADRSLDLASRLDHPFTQCQAFALVALLHQLCGDVDNTRLHSDKTIEMARQYGFQYLIASETARSGWLQIEAGAFEAGLDAIRSGLSLYSETGTVSGLTLIMTTLVEGHLKAGQVEAGLQVADEALAMVAKNGEAYFEPELLRLNGELLLARAQEGDRSQAEQVFRRAHSKAVQQQAKPWIDRTEASLARL